MKRILITGADGFTGFYLANELQRAGYEVHGLVHKPVAGGVPGVARLHVGDLADTARLTAVVQEVQPHQVAHLAAIAFVAHSDASEMYGTNVVGTRNLLEAVAASGVAPQSILLASSANVYGNTPTDPLVETVAPAPANDYAVSKMAMEYMARLWTPRLPITFVRPFNYTGVGQSLNFLLPKIVDHFKRGAKEIELGNLDVARDFSDVRAVVKAYAKLLNVAQSGEVFNVCSGNVFSLQDMLDMMERIAGYKITVKVNPAFVRQGEVRVLRGSNKKLCDKIGEMDMIPLEETLRWMYES
jgi:nucleoside-diphosphate-sugar epimerase